MKTLKLYLEWVSSTWFGTLHQNKYCSVWDKKLNEILDKAINIEIEDYNIVIDGVKIWRENRFYSYGYLNSNEMHTNDVNGRRPSVKTMIRLAKLEIKEISKLEQEQDKKFIEILENL